MDAARQSLSIRRAMRAEGGLGDPGACARRLGEEIAAELEAASLGWQEARLRLRADRICERKLSLPRQQAPDRLPGAAVRLLEGLRLSGPVTEIELEVSGLRPLAYDQLDLLGGRRTERDERLREVLDEVNGRFPGAVRRGGEVADPGETRRERMLSYYDPLRMNAGRQDGRS